MAEERTLKKYATPSTEEPHAIIVYPTVEGNNFEIKHALLNLVYLPNPHIIRSIFLQLY